MRGTVVADATGMGAPVMEMLRGAGGQAEGRDGQMRRVPKRDLVCGLQVMLEKAELRVSTGMRWSGTFVAEAMRMNVRVTASLNGTYAPWRERNPLYCR